MRVIKMFDGCEDLWWDVTKIYLVADRMFAFLLSLSLKKLSERNLVVFL